MSKSLYRLAAAMAVVITAVIGIVTPSYAAGDDPKPVEPQGKTALAVQVDEKGARFEILGDGRWKLSVPAMTINADWMTVYDCYGYFYTPYRSYPNLEWGAEQTCDSQNALPQYLFIWLQSSCTDWWCVSWETEDLTSTPPSENYLRTTRKWDYTPCADYVTPRDYRLKVTPTMRGVDYGPFYSGTTQISNCNV